jgi:protein involved in polysaccharide export with SLBB domain
MNLFNRFSALVFAALLLAGCATHDTGKPITQEDITPAPLFITQGDVLDISFPGASNLSGQHKVGPDGTITLPLVGQVVANGKTTEQLRQELLKLYDKELQDKQVLVSLNSTANLVYVIGAVLRPGRIPMDRPMTALEAIMEAGGFVPTQANLKKVTVVRYDGDHNYTYHLNLSPALEGGPVAPFYLKPRDIVNVPIKVEWF